MSVLGLILNFLCLYGLVMSCLLAIHTFVTPIKLIGKMVDGNASSDGVSKDDDNRVVACNCRASKTRRTIGFKVNHTRDRG